MPSKLNKIMSQNVVLNTVQDQYIRILNPVLDIPLLDGILLESVVLASGANVIPHKLGRPLIGWILTRVRANITVFDTQNSNATPSSNLLLTASGAGTVDLWVF